MENQYTPPKGYHVVESEVNLPENWKLLQSEKGRRVYETPPPRTLIQSRKQLLDLHQKGKWLELDQSQVIFVSKQKVGRKKSFQILEHNIPESIRGKSDRNGSHLGQTLTSGGGAAQCYDRPARRSAQDTARLLRETAVDSSSIRGRPSGQVTASLSCSEETWNTVENINITALAGEHGSSGVTDRSSSVTDRSSSVTDRSSRVTDRSSRVTDMSSSVTDMSSNVTDMSSNVTDMLDNRHGLQYIERDRNNRNLSDSVNTAQKKQQNKIDHDLNKIDEAVRKLTIDPENVIDHKLELLAAAQLLNDARMPNNEMGHNFENLKESVTKCNDLYSMCQALWQQDEARSCLLEMQNSAHLEEMLHIGRSYIDGPLKTFPPDVNQNIYSEIIKFSLVHCPQTVLFLLNLISQKDKQISPNDVVRIATFISTIAHSVNRENNSLAKLKSVLMQKEGLTNEGLDALLVTGLSESSRSQRNVKDFFAGISSEVLKSAAKLYPHVRTMDNLDIRMGGLTHHMTQEFVEIEQKCTKHLDTKSKTFDETKEIFKNDTILLTSEENEQLFQHFRKVVAVTIGRVLSDRVPEANFLKSFFANHYEHPNQNLNPKPAILFIQKPLYLHEIVNEEMIQILNSVQLDFLMLTAEQVANKDDFLSDLSLVQDKDCDTDSRDAAAARMHLAVLECGEYIGSGDYLTFEKFYVAKGLSQTCVTALERFEFIKYFKVALFHMKMNKESYNFYNLNQSNRSKKLSKDKLPKHISLNLD